LIGMTIIFKYLIKEKFWQLILILIITFPLAASLTQTSPIATRTIQATPFFSLVIALAVYWILKILSKKKKRLIFYAAILSSAIIIEFSSYYSHLLKIYPQISWLAWHGFDGSFPQAINWANQKRKKENLLLYLSDKIEQPHIQGLFFTKADPLIWQNHHQAPFKVSSEKEKIPKNGIIVLTKEECQTRKNIEMLKTFGKNQKGIIYCVAQPYSSKKL